MKQYLVTLEGPKFDGLPYATKYKVFVDPDKALSWAKENGFSTTFMMDKIEDLSIGMRQSHAIGIDYVSIMPIEVIQ